MKHATKYTAIVITSLATALTAADTALKIPMPSEQEESHSHDNLVYQLDGLVVVSTATRTERLLKDVPIKTEIIGGNDFEMAGKYDIGQAVELLNH